MFDLASAIGAKTAGGYWQSWPEIWKRGGSIENSWLTGLAISENVEGQGKSYGKGREAESRSDLAHGSVQGASIFSSNFLMLICMRRFGYFWMPMPS